MVVSRKLMAAMAASGFLLTGCAESLWPSLEATDPASAPTQVQAQAPAAPSEPEPTTQVEAVEIANIETVNRASSTVEVTEDLFTSNTNTFVGNKVEEMAGELIKLNGSVRALETSVGELRGSTQSNTGRYHTQIASITSRLQRGTTPGNPRLVERWNLAQGELEQIAGLVPSMVTLANQTADQAAFGQYLLNAVQATYGLSGAVDEDHNNLLKLEDQVQQALVVIDRLQTDLSQDINRQNTYVNNERQNLTTLSLAIKNGELYGSNLLTRAFTQTENVARLNATSDLPSAGEKPLVVIRFDRANVNYQQALYNAVSAALSRKPTATFDLVAVSPDRGTAAQIALNGAAARRNAQDVLRTLTDMGVPGSRVQLLAASDDKIANNEVHLFVR